jgi:hypothetical protein
MPFAILESEGLTQFKETQGTQHTSTSANTWMQSRGENTKSCQGTLPPANCRDDSIAIPPGCLPCISVLPFFNHHHRTGKYMYEQTTGPRRRVNPGRGGKWVALYATLGDKKCNKASSGALGKVFDALGGVEALHGESMARGVVASVAFVQEIPLNEVPSSFLVDGATYVLKLVHMRAVRPPLPITGLKNYRKHICLTPEMNAEIRRRFSTK